jgi:hypothetical protein
MHFVQWRDARKAALVNAVKLAARPPEARSVHGLPKLWAQQGSFDLPLCVHNPDGAACQMIK